MFWIYLKDKGYTDSDSIPVREEKQEEIAVTMYEDHVDVLIWLALFW